MTLRRLVYVTALVVALAPGTASAAHYDTANFSITAPSADLAKRFGDMAEHYRREKAMEWLGKEMPQWSRRCPLRVEVTMDAAGGATTFTFGNDGNRSVVTSQSMEIKGNVKQLLNSVLPHEITHTVLAQHFGKPVPRWADEGGSVLSENDEERYSHDVRCRELLNGGRGIQLRVLFKMTEYPRDMIVLYAQGYSITAYLVERGGGGQTGRAKLLRFLGAGMHGNTAETWNDAARQVYGFESVDGMQVAWLDALRTPPSRIAARGSGGALPASRETASSSGPRTDVRSSSPPPVSVLEGPVRAVARGAAPDGEPAAPPTPRVLAPNYDRPFLGSPELPSGNRP
jgi:hypothetical protein